MLRAHRYNWFVLFLCVAFHDAARPEDGLNGGSQLQFSGVAAVGNARAGLTIPVEAAGRRLCGLIDTGSTTSVFDTSLRGLLKGDALPRMAGTPSGEIWFNYYKAPNLLVAGSELGDGCLEVACADLARIRRATGEPVDIALGMDVLRQFTISIYPRDGVVTCEKSSTRRAKGGIEFSCDEDGVPSIVVPTAHLPSTAADVRTISFVIDAGFFSSVDDGALSRQLFGDLLEWSLHGRFISTPYCASRRACECGRSWRSVFAGYSDQHFSFIKKSFWNSCPLVRAILD